MFISSSIALLFIGEYPVLKEYVSESAQKVDEMHGELNLSVKTPMLK